MADERSAEDTVFIIFEGDYTCLESDERARLEWEHAQSQIGLKLRATCELAAALPEEESKKFANQSLRWHDIDILDRHVHTFKYIFVCVLMYAQLPSFACPAPLLSRFL